MVRLRYSLEEAKLAASKIANDAIQGLDAFRSASLISVTPDRVVPQGTSSKHPTRWIAMYVCHDPNVVLDGGETFGVIDLESQTAEVFR